MAVVRNQPRRHRNPPSVTGSAALLDRYVGYYEPYATSHKALDRDIGMQEEVRNVARSLAAQIALMRRGRREPDRGLVDPRPK